MRGVGTARPLTLALSPDAGERGPECTTCAVGLILAFREDAWLRDWISTVGSGDQR